MKLLLNHKITTGIIALVLVLSVAFGVSNAQAPEPTPQVVPAVLPSTTTTTTTLPALVTTCSQVATLAVAEGLPQTELETALRVAVRESLCTSDAFNATDTMGGSAGIYQINYFWCKPSTYWPTGWLQAHGILTTCDELFNPITNTKAMVAIWNNSGWLPWKTAN
jgi:hypothetical protein